MRKTSTDQIHNARVNYYKMEKRMHTAATGM